MTTGTVTISDYNAGTFVCTNTTGITGITYIITN